MALPEAVRKAAEESDAAIEALQKAQQESEAQATPLEDLLAPEPSDQTPDTYDPSGEIPQIEEPEAADPVVEEKTDQVVDEPEAPTQDTVDWESRYKSLQGKYNAEVPRLQDTVNSMQQQMSVLIAKAIEAKPSVEEIEAEKGPAHMKYLKEDEVADYGEEVLELQARMAKGVAEQLIRAEVSPLLKRIEYLESQVTESSDQIFWSKVEEQVPGAREMNQSDASWHAFLDGIEPNSGLSYREIGARAVSEGRPSRLVTLFKSYLGTNSSGVEEPPVASDAPKVPTAKPRKTASKANVAPREKAKPSFTEKDIQRFYTDCVRGKFKGRDEERRKLEREIDLAVSEGRIAA